MALITYDDKDKNEPSGDPKRLWRDEDANQVKEVVNENAVQNALLIWDMSTGQMPAGQTFGKRVYGINGPHSSLRISIDGVMTPIPNGTFATVIKASGTAATTPDLADWAFETTFK